MDLAVGFVSRFRAPAAGAAIAGKDRSRDRRRPSVAGKQ